MQKFSAQSAENEREAQSDVFGLQNSFKAVTGYRGWIEGPGSDGQESSRRKELCSSSWNPIRSANRSSAIPGQQISKAVDVQKQIYKLLFYLDNLGGFRGDLARYARQIVRVAAEKQLPSNQRIRGYQDSQLPTLEQQLFSTAPIYKALEQAELTESLGEMQEALGAGDTDVTEGAGR